MNPWGHLLEMLGQELGAGTLEQVPRMTLTYLQGREPSVLRTVTTGSAHWDRNDTKPHTEKASDLQAPATPQREATAAPLCLPSSPPAQAPSGLVTSALVTAAGVKEAQRQL